MLKVMMEMGVERREESGKQRTESDTETDADVDVDVDENK